MNISYDSFQLFKNFVNNVPKRPQNMRSVWGPKPLSPEEKLGIFDQIYQTMLVEYKQKLYPYLSAMMLNTATTTAISGNYYFHMWEVLLYKYLADPDQYQMDEAKREIIDSFDQNILQNHPIRAAKFKELLAYITKVDQKYLFSQATPTDTVGSKVGEIKQKKTQDMAERRAQEAKQVKIEEELREHREQEMASIQKEAKEARRKIDQELQEYREQQLALIQKALEEEKKAQLEALKHDPQYQLMKEDLAANNAAVAEMVEKRKQMEDLLTEKMNTTTRDFRDRTQEVTEQITTILTDYLKLLSEDMQKSVSQLEAHTDNAINSVVDVNRNLHNDDFSDLLHGYRDLEVQLFYKGRSGTETEEYKTYWKNVQVYLKRFEKTLNKLGYTRFMPEIGATLDAATMEPFGEDLVSDFPAGDSEYEEFKVESFVSSGFRDSSGEVEVKARVLPVRKIGGKEGEDA